MNEYKYFRRVGKRSIETTDEGRKSLEIVDKKRMAQRNGLSPSAYTSKVGRYMFKQVNPRTGNETENTAKFSYATITGFIEALEVEIKTIDKEIDNMKRDLTVAHEVWLEAIEIAKELDPKKQAVHS